MIDYKIPVLNCACGERFPLDTTDNVEFFKTCLVCGMEFHIKATSTFRQTKDAEKSTKPK